MIPVIPINAIVCFNTGMDLTISIINLTKKYGERGIRTLGRVAPTTVFETARFNHSRISPIINKSVPKRT
jgi:hypothetical protein